MFHLYVQFKLHLCEATSSSIPWQLGFYIIVLMIIYYLSNGKQVKRKELILEYVFL